MSVDTIQSTLLEFFGYLFSDDEGYICIATTRPPAKRDTFHEEYFDWPRDKAKMIEYIDKVAPSYNVYFGVNMLSVPRRKKDNCIPQNLVWADLDSCRPDQLDIVPQCVIESSPNRYQSIWRLDRKIDPRIAEHYSKRIAYHYAGLGVDKAGHDLTQLLRVPGTFNFKYQLDDVPQVLLLTTVDGLLPVEVFEALPQPEIGDADVPAIPVPDSPNLPTVDMILHRYEEHLRPTAFARYYAQEPVSDWSKHLWRLINTCFDVGMTAEETFVIARNAKCNKYERDGRPESHLWREVLKAELEHKSISLLLEDHRQLVMPALLTTQEESSLQTTLVDDYMDWATSVTDAVPDYHELCCTMNMSILMSTTLRLPTQNARIVPNLWGLVIGESTLTRKSTAVDMALDYIYEIDKTFIVASDASPEGLMNILSTRPKMVSVFHRDEVTGFFDAINRKEYLASMPEILTKMYDVPKYMPRTLRKETYIVSEPIFIFFGGGVPDRLYSIVDEQYWLSGFMPRFLSVYGEADIDKVQPTGPPVSIPVGKRHALAQTFRALYNMYTDQQVTIKLGDGQQMTQTPEIEVEFTAKMWDRASSVEKQLNKVANDAPVRSRALPALNRMYFSMLKLTMLFAAARSEPQEYKIKAEMRDLLSAMWYIQKWGKHTVNLVNNSGGSADESRLQSVYRLIERHPGINRGEVMARHHLNAKQMDLIQETLVQRLMLHTNKKGRGIQYYPIGK